VTEFAGGEFFIYLFIFIIWIELIIFHIDSLLQNFTNASVSFSHVERHHAFAFFSEIMTLPYPFVNNFYFVSKSEIMPLLSSQHLFCFKINKMGNLQREQTQICNVNCFQFVFKLNKFGWKNLQILN
jgi:hypothetical protein